MTTTTRPRRGRRPALPFEDALEALDEFQRDYGRLPTRSECSASGFQIGAWLSRQITKNTNGKLAAEDYQALQARGVVFPHDSGHTPHLSLAQQAKQDTEAHSHWAHHLAVFAAFVAEHGHARMPLDYVAPDGTSMQGFLWRTRLAYRQGELPQYKIDALTALGFEWDPGPGRKDYPEVFAARLRCLDWYAEETGGDVNPQRRYLCGHDECAHWDLGEFLYRARGKYWAGRLTDEQVLALERRGVDWDPTGLRSAHRQQ